MQTRTVPAQTPHSTHGMNRVDTVPVCVHVHVLVIYMEQGGMGKVRGGILSMSPLRTLTGFNIWVCGWIPSEAQVGFTYS